MPKNANEKIKLILIWQMLKQDSDEDHPLSTSDIINKLYEKGYSAERKAIYDAVKLLNENGFEVLSYRDTQNKYYVVDRSFDIAELKILLDAIQAASFITEKKTEIFIDKIAALAGSNRAKLLKKNINTHFLQGSNDEYIALFALQTAYMIIVKIIAYRIASIVRYKATLIDFETLIDIDSEALRHHLVTLENGAIFRDYGITNLLEGDFFSWYSTKEQWTSDIATNISGIFSILSLYSDKAVLNTGAKSTDFFKELYQGMIPSAVRHSLGEYYTKRWVAQQVVDEALNLAPVENWKGMGGAIGANTCVGKPSGSLIVVTACTIEDIL